MYNEEYSFDSYLSVEDIDQIAIKRQFVDTYLESEGFNPIYYNLYF